MSHRASLPGPGAPIFRWSFPLRLLAAGLLVVSAQAFAQIQPAPYDEVARLTRSGQFDEARTTIRGVQLGQDVDGCTFTMTKR